MGERIGDIYVYARVRPGDETRPREPVFPEVRFDSVRPRARPPAHVVSRTAAGERFFIGGVTSKADPFFDERAGWSRWSPCSRKSPSFLTAGSGRDQAATPTPWSYRNPGDPRFASHSRYGGPMWGRHGRAPIAPPDEASSMNIYRTAISPDSRKGSNGDAPTGRPGPPPTQSATAPVRATPRSDRSLSTG
jgi:hypothetical protein